MALIGQLVIFEARIEQRTAVITRLTLASDGHGTETQNKIHRGDTGGADGGEAGMSAAFESETSRSRTHAVFLARSTSDGRTPRAHPSM